VNNSDKCFECVKWDKEAFICRVGYDEYINEEKCPGFKKGFDDTHLKIMKETQSVLKVIPKIDQDSVVWKIKIRDKWFELKSEKMLRAETFRRKWLDKFNELISFKGTPGTSPWNDLVNFWAQQAKISNDDDEIDHEQVAIDTIIEWIQTCEPTEEIETSWRNPHYIHSNGTNKALYPSKHISQLMRTEKISISLSRLRKLLDPYLVGNTEVVRIGNKTRRFWAFKTELINQEGEDVVKDEI